MNRTITPSILPKPRGYSHGVSTTGTVLYVAGQVAHDTTGRMVSPEFTAQFGQCRLDARHALHACLADSIRPAAELDDLVDGIPEAHVRR
jgi:enamine deaminase RidA (YjgF/YER057c/UK114 family)